MMDIACIHKKLSKLRLSGIIPIFEERLTQAMKDRWSYSDFIDIMLTDEISRRDNKQLIRRLARSHLKADKTLETLNFGFNPQLPATLIKELAQCCFVEKKQNIFILGPSGVGKSHLAQGLGHEACRKQIDVRFYDTYELFEWLHQGKGDGSYKKKLAEIIETPLLILDDFGLQALTVAQQEDLYQVVAQKYEKNSIMITSNRDLGEWSSMFTNPLLGMAAVDRLVHNGIQLVIEGESYRLSQFKKSHAKKA